MLAGDLEHHPGLPTAKPTVPQPGLAAAPPLPGALAIADLALLDAGGLPLPASRPTAPPVACRARASTHGRAGRRAGLNGQIAGLAGFDVWLDGTKLAAVPTTRTDLASRAIWQIALDTGTMPAGQHTIDMHGLTAPTARSRRCPRP